MDVCGLYKDMSDFDWLRASAVLVRIHICSMQVSIERTQGCLQSHVRPKVRAIRATNVLQSSSSTQRRFVAQFQEPEVYLITSIPYQALRPP